MPRVLVIEDDAAISALMADALRGDGFEVDTAENGAVAMAKVRDAPPDLITLDLMMPVMNGWEFMRQWGEMPGCACGGFWSCPRYASLHCCLGSVISLPSLSNLVSS